MRKAMFLLCLFIFAASTSWSKCENMAFFFTDTGVLDLPCVDVGSGKCWKAKLKLDPEALEDNSVEFDLLEADETNRPLPTGEDKILTSTFDSNTYLLHVPYVVIDSNGSEFEVVLKLEVIHGPQTDDLFFTIHSIKPVVMPNVCQEQGSLASCEIYDETLGLIYCLEFSGSASFVNEMVGACPEESAKKRTACPAGALASCTAPFPGEENVVTSYAYHSYAVTMAMAICHQSGIGAVIPNYPGL